ncbi:hypothetical protein VC87395_000778 [Vibrio paracholerae 87395]|nr:hypothetical protein VC87395_000778 [Vibrio paracholerae 87395]
MKVTLVMGRIRETSLRQINNKSTTNQNKKSHNCCGSFCW